MRVFPSHVSEEAPEARALKKVLEQGVPGIDVFVSAVDIHLGTIGSRRLTKHKQASKRFSPFVAQIRCVGRG